MSSQSELSPVLAAILERRSVRQFVDAPVDSAPRSLVERVDRGEVGVKSGKGFFDYDGRPLEDVLHERDAAMIDVFNDMKDRIYKRI